MKKAVLFLGLMFFGFVSFAQNSEKHITFKGVPVDGFLSEYVAKMKYVGFEYVRGDSGEAVLKGDFAGYKGCTLKVATPHNHNLVHQITVLFPKQKDWVGLYGDYSRLKSLLSQKYGEPAKVEEIFLKYARDDTGKILRLRSNDCRYCSTFSVDNGEILLSIICDNEDYACKIKLVYTDKINSTSFDNAAMNDL